jgi:hypothetical protein
MLERNATLKGIRRLNVNEVSRYSDSLNPEMRPKRGSNHHSTGSLKNMTMLTLGDTILSMGAGTRELSKGALLSKNTTQVLGDILSAESTRNT